jgi:Ca2+-transporting ATPase
MNTLLAKHWHHLPREEIATLLESDGERGLDTFEVAHRQASCGLNRLTVTQGKGPLVLFLLQFHQPLVYILLGAVAVTFALQEWVDSGVIFAVVLVNAVIGFIQESRALKAIEALARSMEGSATVIRAGDKAEIPSVELVPGDLVLLQSGDKVPADLRLLRTRELQIDESARRLENFLRVCNEELKAFARLTGNDDVHKLAIGDMCTTNSEISNHTDIKHV